MAHRVFYCDHHEIPLPDGHKFPMRKYRLLRDRLSATGLFDLQPAPLASLDQVTRVHDAAYAQAFVDGTLDPQMMRRIGFPWSPGLVQRTLASVGSTLAASRVALETGWGGGLAGGTHHAFRDAGSGFCIFNDMAVAIAVLRAEGRIGRVAIVDLDVHQGDGTATLFADDPETLTISLHGRNNFPFRKQQSKFDIEFEDGATDEEYLPEVARVLDRVREFSPDIIYFQSGVDALATDRLGKLSLTHDGLKQRDALVLALPHPLVIVMGGGYSEPVESTVEGHFNTFTAAAARGAPQPG
ncbi:MAG: histone deacetylase [Acidobacteria bacterium]|nr:histone deacetylase [Acidobacteriota bacterium]